MILIFFDLGTVCIIFFFMTFVGVATAAELGSWVHEHFAWVVIAILIFSLCKSLIMQNKIKMPFSNKFICSIADTIRLVPATLFLQMIDEMVKLVGIDLNTIDAIAVSGGPGSFTGLRIGSATAKGLGLALNKPLIHVPTLDATAYNLFGASGLICPIMDARRNQVYTGIYRFEKKFETVMDQDAMDMGELIEKLNAMGERVIFLGDGVPVYEKQIAEKMTVPYDLAPAHVNRQRAASVATLGAVYFAEGKTETAMEHKPDYLRKSQAEREREEREAKNA